MTNMMALVLACGLVYGGCKGLPDRPRADTVCDAFCEALADMRCDGANGSPGRDGIDGTSDDVPCVTICLHTQRNDPWADGDAECVRKADTCTSAETCAFGQ